MKAILLAVSLSCFLFSSPLWAQRVTETQTQNTREHSITVIRNGTIFAKPDLGILAMTIESSAALPEEAVAENGRKAKEVVHSLEALGYASGTGYKLTSVVVGEGGAGHFGPIQPGITVYAAVQYVYVFFEAADLADVVHLTEKSVAAMEALRKAGAVPAAATGPRTPQMMGGGLIIYTIKDSSPFEKQALQKAIGRARDAAQEIASSMPVQITGVHNIRSSGLAGNYMPRSGLPYLEGLPYLFYSTKSDEIEISVNATIDYDFK
jgi:uncharacterized protein YggE